MLNRLLDALIEAPVVTSFTRLGYDARSRLDHWTSLSSYDLTGRVIVVTGATSGIGRVAAEQFASCGASVVVSGRDRAKTERVRDEIAARSGNDRLDVLVADMGELGQVRAAAESVLSRHDRLDVLVHNAGALRSTRQVSLAGIERTVASQVVGPFLLTELLLDRLRATGPGRVITMSSGGMYAANLTVEQLEMGEGYGGSEQYARAKRAQVTLNEMWAERVPAAEVVFHAMHPGWADTPGVREALPTFRTMMGPLLRSPAQAADTLVWLAADDGEPLHSSGLFWLDRRVRPIHKVPMTRRSDTPDRRQRLWEWTAAASVIESDG